jgi:hypothetical protein
LEPSGHEEERKTKEDLEEVSRGRGTERRKDVDRSRWRSFLKALCFYTGDNRN